MKSSDLIKHLTESGLMPQEEMLEVARGEQVIYWNTKRNSFTGK